MTKKKREADWRASPICSGEAILELGVLGVFGILGTGRCVAILNNSLGVHWQRLLEEGWEIAGGTASMQHISKCTKR